VDNIVPNFRESVLDHSSDPFKGSGIKEIGENGQIFYNSSNYIHNAFVKEEYGKAETCEVKGRCYRSQKKSEAPRKLKLKIADRKGIGNMAGEKGYAKRVNITA